MILLTGKEAGKGLVTEIETGSETDTENGNEIVKGLESGMVGDTEMEEEE